jgi:PAS domain S-box-containing protein
VQDPLEGERLAALERLEVLDSPSEPLFDSLTDLAAQTFNTPIALISLVDQERQWFKACVGLDVDHTPRDISFCQHAILSNQVFVVLDAANDERFRDNPLVTGPPDIRFYAGAPLITPEGYRLGTLCVIDKVARQTFTDAEAFRLQAIAKSVMQALLLRLDSRELERIAVVSDQQNSLLKLAEDMAGVGTWSWDLAADRTTWSDQVYRIHGYELGVEPPALQSVLERYHPDDAKILADHVQRAVAEGRDYELEARIYRPDGSERHVVARGACRKGPNGAVAAIVGTLQDITEHVTAERFIRALTDNLPGMVAYWDADLRCRFANAAYGEWFGQSPESMLTITLPDLLGAELFAKNQQYIQAALNGQAETFSRTLIKPSGEVGHTWAHYIPDIDASGRAQGFYVLVSDVTALKQAEEKMQATNVLLEAARDQAEAAAAVKAEFLANMSHEIRTPLTAILGFTGLLAGRADLPETARMMVSRVKGASTALLSIVNDILDFSKLEAGQMKIDPKPIDVVAVAEDALAMFGPQAEAKSLWLEFEATPDIPGRVCVDPDRLRQILLNLIGNAVKFTDKGTVRLRLGYDAKEQSLRVRVEDTGAGMDEAQIARLFQRFSQVDASSTRRHGGTGLGLAICRGLTEAMGGEIGVDSTPGQGSAFHFYIDAPSAASPIETEEESASSASLSGVRVLVADDNAANRELARALLQQFDAEVTEAVDGAEVVALAADAPFDAILIDLHMPVLDGQGALHRIRSEFGPNQDAPIFAFTADGADTVNCGAGGFDGVIGKPIVAANMVATLIQATQRQTPEMTPEANHAVGF